MRLAVLDVCRPPARNDNYRLALIDRLRESMGLRDSAVGEVVNFVRQLHNGINEIEGSLHDASPPEGDHDAK